MEAVELEVGGLSSEVPSHMDFNELLEAYGDLFYSLLGGQPRRGWLERKPLRAGGVSPRRVSLLYPDGVVLHQVAARFTVLLRTDKHLREQWLTLPGIATHALSEVLPETLNLAGYNAPLRRWQAGRGEHLQEAKSYHLCKAVTGIAWALENASAFEPDQQLQLLEAIEAFACSLNGYPNVRTPAYLLGAALSWKAEALVGEAGTITFPVCERAQRLADLWAWSLSG